MVSLDKKIAEVEKLIERVGLGRTSVNKAMRLALNKTIKSVAFQTEKGVSSSTDIKDILIRERIKQIKAVRSQKAAISVLAYSMPAVVLGTPVQTETGVDVGGRFFPGAFIAHAERKKGRARDFIFRRRYQGSRYPLIEERIPIAGNVEREFQSQLIEVQDKLINNFTREVKLFGGLFG